MRALLSGILAFIFVVDQGKFITGDNFTSASNELSSSMLSYLQQSSIIYGLTALRNDNVSEACAEQLGTLQAGIRQSKVWALKVLDGSGSKSPGYMLDNSYWLGSRDSCESAQHIVDLPMSSYIASTENNLDLLNALAPFDVAYRMAYFQMNTTKQVTVPYFYFSPHISLGLCLPRACTVPDIESLLRQYTAESVYPESVVYNMDLQLLYVKSLEPDWSIHKSPFFIFYVILLTFTALMVLGAAFRRRNTPILGAEGSTEKTKVVGLWQQFVGFYDLKANWLKITTLHDYGEKEIPIVDALRTFSAFAIICLHMLAVGVLSVPNRIPAMAYFDYLKNLVFAVDIFFAISGFLRVYNFIAGKKLDMVRENDWKSNIKEFLVIIFHRYLRLTPLNLALIVLTSTSFKFFESITVPHMGLKMDELCSRYWWRNALFIHNFYDYNEMCALWTWSLACDMQYFVLFTLLLFIYAKYPTLAKLLVVALLIANTAWTFYISELKHFFLSLDSTVVTLTDIYASSLVRILPYIVGAIAAWLLTGEHRKHLLVSEKVANYLWFFCSVGFVLLFAVHLKQGSNVLIATFVYLNARLSAAIITCWMLISSVTRCGESWLRCVEVKWGQFIGRISYGMSLINPLVISGYALMSGAAVHMDVIVLGVLFIGFAVIICVCSLVSSLLFEMPYNNLSSWLQRRAKEQRAKQ